MYDHFFLIISFFDFVFVFQKNVFFLKKKNSFIFFHFLSFHFILFYFLSFSFIFLHFPSFSFIFLNFPCLCWVLKIFFLGLNFVTISHDSSYVKNQFLGPSRVVGNPFGPPVFLFFSYFFLSRFLPFLLLFIFSFFSFFDQFFIF